MVALIPADDERLQPSKTKTYVFIAVVCSLLLAFLTIFFIYPRSFNLALNKKEPDLYPIDLYINTTGKCFLAKCSQNIKINVRKIGNYILVLCHRHCFFSAEQVVQFNIQNWWFLQNPNYYPIHLTSLNVQAYMNKMISENSNVSGKVHLHCR